MVSNAIPASGTGMSCFPTLAAIAAMDTTASLVHIAAFFVLNLCWTRFLVAVYFSFSTLIRGLNRVIKSRMAPNLKWVQSCTLYTILWYLQY